MFRTDLSKAKTEWKAQVAALRVVIATLDYGLARVWERCDTDSEERDAILRRIEEKEAM
jgi:hypothetical protein